MDFWATVFIAEKPTIDFSSTEMLGRYLRKYWEQNKPFFQYFYIQTELKVNKIHNGLFKHF